MEFTRIELALIQTALYAYAQRPMNPARNDNDHQKAHDLWDRVCSYLSKDHPKEPKRALVVVAETDDGPQVSAVYMVPNTIQGQWDPYHGSSPIDRYADAAKIRVFDIIPDTSKDYLDVAEKLKKDFPL